jgi:toxin HigB-1
MISSFRHKGLKQLFELERSKAISPDLVNRVKIILDYLDAADTIHDMNVPGLRLHELKGSRKDTWSVTVSGNWRLTFRFHDGDSHDVDLEDYH